MLVVEGVGLRLGKRSGPLLDAGVTLESIALHAYAEIDSAGAEPVQGRRRAAPVLRASPSAPAAAAAATASRRA